MNLKLVKMILEEVEHGKRKRWEVTDRLRNHDRKSKVEAIKYCTGKGLVSLSLEKAEGAGRNPTYVEITPSGKEELARLKSEIEEFGIWSA